jgi:hypothetical protein
MDFLVHQILLEAVGIAVISNAQAAPRLTGSISASSGLPSIPEWKTIYMKIGLEE